MKVTVKVVAIKISENITSLSKETGTSENDFVNYAIQLKKQNINTCLHVLELPIYAKSPRCKKNKILNEEPSAFIAMLDCRSDITMCKFQKLAVSHK